VVWKVGLLNSRRRRCDLAGNIWGGTLVWGEIKLKKVGKIGLNQSLTCIHPFPIPSPAPVVLIASDQLCSKNIINPLTPNDHNIGRTAPLTSKRCILYIYSTNIYIYILHILNMLYILRFFPLQNAVCFIILTYLVPVLFTFYIQCVLKLKK